MTMGFQNRRSVSPFPSVRRSVLPSARPCVRRSVLLSARPCVRRSVLLSARPCVRRSVLLSARSCVFPAVLLFILALGGLAGCPKNGARDARSGAGGGQGGGGPAGQPKICLLDVGQVVSGARQTPRFRTLWKQVTAMKAEAQRRIDGMVKEYRKQFDLDIRAAVWNKRRPWKTQEGKFASYLWYLEGVCAQLDKHEMRGLVRDAINRHEGDTRRRKTKARGGQQCRDIDVWESKGHRRYQKARNQRDWVSFG